MAKIPEKSKNTRELDIAVLKAVKEVELRKADPSKVYEQIRESKSVDKKRFARKLADQLGIQERTLKVATSLILAASIFLILAYRYKLAHEAEQATGIGHYVDSHGNVTERFISPIDQTPDMVEINLEEDSSKSLGG